MTSGELKTLFYDQCDGVESRFPKYYYVDAETFGHVAHDVFENSVRHKGIEVAFKGELDRPSYISIDLLLGPSGGLMFKGVEILLK